LCAHCCLASCVFSSPGLVKVSQDVYTSAQTHIHTYAHRVTGQPPPTQNWDFSCVFFGIKGTNSSHFASCQSETHSVASEGNRRGKESSTEPPHPRYKEQEVNRNVNIYSETATRIYITTATSLTAHGSQKNRVVCTSTLYKVSLNAHKVPQPPETQGYTLYSLASRDLCVKIDVVCVCVCMH